jgi:pimeloyl-ACP methyl ester carboxylesterase
MNPAPTCHRRRRCPVMSPMSTLAFDRTGTGDPLLLLHGIGLTRTSWDPVIPALAERFEVIAVDLPGFGDSEPLPPAVEPDPAALARAVGELLEELQISAPHVAGNSLGGWVALELAAQRPVATVTLLSPAGLWRGDTPLYCRVSLRATRWLCRHAAGLLDPLVGSRPGRALAFGQILGRPARMTPGQARAAIHAMGTCAGFDTVLRATVRRRYRSPAHAIQAPVTIAFGSRDRILLKHQSRHLDELPSGTHVGTLPRCGHVPMTDNPDAVTSLVTSAVLRAARPAEHSDQ